MDNKLQYAYYIVIFFSGIFIDLMIAYYCMLIGIDAIGNSFTVENMNVTLAINETALIEYMNQTRVP